MGAVASGVPQTACSRHSAASYRAGQARMPSAAATATRAEPGMREAGMQGGMMEAKAAAAAAAAQ